ncbi:MAG TPA: hypothetical protein PKZ36_03010 [Candidatus Paceibacterota bacterium]|nr:hypothetical protein [Candidatus Paceibacterota bacterium]HPT18349.1 hypothetical protein [Candidatus Paceibacterota bacterium]
MNIEKEEIDNLLYKRNTEHKENHADKYIDHYLEQYRIYIHVFNSTSQRRLKSNEFFLTINTAIIGILGYIESTNLIDKPVIYLLVPFVGIAICYSWYRIIYSYRIVKRAKYKVIHSIEKKLPLSLFETEWEILGKGKGDNKYKPLSEVEMYIPMIFIVLYILIFLANIPWPNFFIR